MPFISNIPENTGPEGILEKFPESGGPILQATLTLLGGSEELPKAYCELIAAYTSGLNSCDFCYGGHTAFAEAYGVEEGLLEKLLNDVESTDLESKLKVMLKHIKKVTKESYKITQNDVDSVLSAGWSTGAYYHAVALCSLFNFYNRLVDSYGLVLPPGFKEHIKEHISRGGSVQDH
jgi:AhpD family alkylhydroperoxidase